jgi:hypothetical protein
MILGEWLLYKTEMIGFNDNDSSIISTLNTKSDKIIFEKNKVKTYHELDPLWNIVQREYYYEITSDTLVNVTYMQLSTTKRKRYVEQIEIISYNFNELVFEKNILDVGLGVISTKVRYYYSRTGKPEVEVNPILGVWFFKGTVSFERAKPNDNKKYTFYKIEPEKTIYLKKYLN